MIEFRRIAGRSNTRQIKSGLLGGLLDDCLHVADGIRYDFILASRLRELLISQTETASRRNPTFFLPSLFQGIRLLATESRTFPARSPKFHSQGETTHATTSARASSHNSDIRHQRKHRVDRC